MHILQSKGPPPMGRLILLTPLLLAAKVCASLLEIAVALAILHTYDDLNHELKAYYTLVVTMSVTYIVMWVTSTLVNQNVIGTKRVLTLFLTHLFINLYPLYLDTDGLAPGVYAFTLFTSLLTLFFTAFALKLLHTLPPEPEFEPYDDDLDYRNEMRLRWTVFAGVVLLCFEFNLGMQVGVRASGKRSHWGYIIGGLTPVWAALTALFLSLKGRYRVPLLLFVVTLAHTAIVGTHMLFYHGHLAIAIAIISVIDIAVGTTIHRRLFYLMQPTHSPMATPPA